MTTSYTSLLGLALPVTGELSGTWGDTVNNYITQYLDSSIAGALTVNADTTLTKTTNAALGSTSSQYAILIASGHSTNITVTAPAASKAYLVINTSGTYTVKIRGAGPTTGITLAAGENALVGWNGSDFVKVASSVGVQAGSANTFTALQTFAGNATALAAMFTNAKEKVTVSATAATGTINFDVLTQGVLYYTTNASANWTINIRGSSSATLDSLMSTGEVVTVVFLATNGATPYRQTALTIDGASVTPKWQGGLAPAAGNASAIDAYTLTIIKTASATFTVLESATQFK